MRQNSVYDTFDPSSNRARFRNGRVHYVKSRKSTRAIASEAESHWLQGSTWQPNPSDGAFENRVKGVLTRI